MVHIYFYHWTQNCSCTFTLLLKGPTFLSKCCCRYNDNRCFRNKTLIVRGNILPFCHSFFDTLILHPLWHIYNVCVSLGEFVHHLFLIWWLKQKLRVDVWSVVWRPLLNSPEESAAWWMYATVAAVTRTVVLGSICTMSHHHFLNMFFLFLWYWIIE